MIAAINGPAAGAGFSLALACAESRIASEASFFACPYGRIGALAGRRHDLLPAPRGGTQPGRWNCCWKTRT